MGNSPDDSFPHSWHDDGDSPNLLTLLSGMHSVHAAVRDLPEDYLAMSELELEKLIRKNHPQGRFDRTLGFIKINFWAEYNNAIKGKRKMTTWRIIGGLVHDLWFKRHVVDNKLNLAWIVAPPNDEMLVKKEMLQLAMRKMRAAMDGNIFRVEYSTVIDRETGKRVTKRTKNVDVPLLKEIHNISKTLSDRIHGAVAQRHQVEQKNLNVNVDATHAGGASIEDPNLTMEQLDQFAAKLQSIQSQLVALPGMSEPDPDLVLEIPIPREREKQKVRRK